MRRKRPIFYAPQRNRSLELPIAIRVDETCVTNSEQLPHFLDSLGNHAVRLAGLKLALELNENAISAVKPSSKDCRNVKGSDWVSREKGRSIGNEKLRGFQSSHMRCMRLV